MNMLIVDDEKSIAKFLHQVALSQEVNDVDVASSAEEALAFVVRRSYDLITLDLHMPGASGLEILTLLRNMCPHAIIAIISGKITTDILPDMGGCVDLVLHKPAEVQVLIQLISLVKTRVDNMASLVALSEEKITVPEPKQFE